MLWLNTRHQVFYGYADREHLQRVPESAFFDLDEEIQTSTTACELLLQRTYQSGVHIEQSEISEGYWLGELELDDALPHGNGLYLPVSFHSDDQTVTEYVERLLANIFDSVFCNPIKQLGEALYPFRYPGALRETLRRHYSAQCYPDGSRWYSGLGASDSK